MEGEGCRSGTAHPDSRLELQMVEWSWLETRGPGCVGAALVAAALPHGWLCSDVRRACGCSSWDAWPRGWDRAGLGVSLL